MSTDAKNIVLVGFMGAGKSTLAKMLAERLGRAVVCTDDRIEAREGRPITEIFAQSGEPYFRRVEKAVVAEAAAGSGRIIDCGGGVVLDPENLAVLKRSGKVFFLAATPEVIYARIKDQTHRPLLHTPDPQARIAELLEARQAFYAQADYTIDTNDDQWTRIMDEIIALAGPAEQK